VISTVQRNHIRNLSFENFSVRPQTKRILDKDTHRGRKSEGRRERIGPRLVCVGLLIGFYDPGSCSASLPRRVVARQEPIVNGALLRAGFFPAEADLILRRNINIQLPEEFNETRGGGGKGARGRREPEEVQAVTKMAGAKMAKIEVIEGEGFIAQRKSQSRARPPPFSPEKLSA